MVKYSYLPSGVPSRFSFRNSLKQRALFDRVSLISPWIQYTVLSIHYTLSHVSTGNQQGARAREGWRVPESRPGACTCTITSVPWYVYWASVMAMVLFHTKMSLLLSPSTPSSDPETRASMTTGTAAAAASPVSAAGSASHRYSFTSLFLGALLCIFPSQFIWLPSRACITSPSILFFQPWPEPIISTQHGLNNWFWVYSEAV